MSERERERENSLLSAEPVQTVCVVPTVSPAGQTALVPICTLDYDWPPECFYIWNFS